jgi:hypothetical protein
MVVHLEGEVKKFSCLIWGYAGLKKNKYGILLRPPKADYEGLKKGMVKKVPESVSLSKEVQYENDRDRAAFYIRSFEFNK